MWWPAIGGLVIGIGGFFFPQALGVGYDVIGGLLQGDDAAADHRRRADREVDRSGPISLGSGTSGGVLAPLLMMGGALGGLEAHVPARGKAPASGRSSAWARSSAARCGRRSPASIFALELTHDVNVLLPLLLAVTIAHGFTVLTLRRSILTEKVSRRGFHLSREYAIDPLEIIFAREVVRTRRRGAARGRDVAGGRGGAREPPSGGSSDAARRRCTAGTTSACFRSSTRAATRRRRDAQPRA